MYHIFNVTREYFHSLYVPFNTTRFYKQWHYHKLLAGYICMQFDFTDLLLGRGEVHKYETNYNGKIVVPAKVCVKLLQFFSLKKFFFLL